MKQIEKEERLDRFNAEAISDLIREFDINSHSCEHTPDKIIPIRIESDMNKCKQILISKCSCCNAEIIEEYPLPYMDESMMN